ncbi:MAG: hypothetical protein II574_09060 [Ruminococcus sp.]|nr:hypothetical protein [Ruminococcus sp.]
MAKKKKTHKKPQRKAQNTAQNNTPVTSQNKPYSSAPTTQSKPMLLRIFILALIALLVLGLVATAIAAR